MADLGTTVIVDISLNAQDAKQKAIDLTNQIIALKDKQDLLRASGQALSVGYQQNSLAISQLTQQQKAYIALSQNENDSDRALAAQLKILTAQYSSLTQEEKTNTAAGIALTAQIANIKQQLNDSGAAIKNFTGQVGSYTESINKSSVGNNQFGSSLANIAASQVPFGNQLLTLVKGTNSLAGAFELGGVAAVALGAGVAVVGAALVAGGAYLSSYTPFVNGLKQDFAGLYQAFIVFGDAVRTGDYQNLGKNLTEASDAARELTAQLQILQGEIAGNAVQTADYEAKIAELTLKMRNVRNTPAQEADYYNQIQGLAQKNYNNQKLLADLSFKNAVDMAANGKKLNDFDLNQINDIRNRGAATAAYLLELDGKINAGSAERIAKAQEMDIAAERYATQSQERAQNRLDSNEKRNEAREKALADRQTAIDKDREKSAINILKTTQSIRQQEYLDIEQDIAQRKLQAQKYGVDTTYLETERLARIKALNIQFAKETLDSVKQLKEETDKRNAANITDSLLLTPKENTGTIDPFAAKQASLDEEAKAILASADKSIAALQKRMAQGEKGLTELLQGAINDRLSKVKDSNIKQAKLDLEKVEYQVALTKQAEDAAQVTRKLNSEEFQREADNNKARIELNKQLSDSYESLFGSVYDLAGRNSTIAKAAFTLEKSFAIAKIIINAEEEKSEIALAAAKQASFYAGFGPVGVAIAAGYYIAAAAKEAEVTVKETEQVVTIAATTIAGEISGGSGHARGGLIIGPGTPTSDSIPARLSNGESVINAKSTMMFRPLLSQINEAGGGQAFASGGVVGAVGGSYIPTLSNQASNNSAIAHSLAGSLKGMNFYVSVEEFNAVANRVEVLENNANF